MKMSPRVVVISDLHLSPAAELGNFFAGPELVRFTTEQAKTTGPGDVLVLAGDVIDFLMLEERPPELHLATAARLGRSVMDRCRRETVWMNPWLRALAAWLERGGEIVLIPGNHDLEWFHPDTDAIWKEALETPAAARFRIHREADPWRTQVGAWEAIVGHGHRGDAMNDCDPVVIHRALQAGKESIPLPPGSQFVVETLHAFKRAMDPKTGQRRFRFLDAVKPEPVVFALLLALDTRLCLAHLPAVLSVKAAEIRRNLVRMLRHGPSLSPENAPTDIPDDWNALIASEMRDGMGPEPVPFEIAEVELENFFAGVSGSAPGTLSAGGNRVSRWLVRAWLKKSQRELTAFFDPGCMADADNAVAREWLPSSLGEEIHRVVVCGHTHAARAVHWKGKPHHYLNTGTWTNLLDCSAVGDSDEAIQKFLIELETGKPSYTRRLTWAEILPDGPRLMEYAPQSNS